MCNKVVYNYVDTVEFVTDGFKAQEMCDKAVNTFFI